MKNTPSILFGGDYNPEQWDETTWQEDLDKLKKAQVNSATINVFSWSVLEPREGEFHFEQLDKIINLLEQNNISIVFATATATVPPWLARKYPEVMRVDTQGIRQLHGKRHNACPNSPIFQKSIKRLVTELMERYSERQSITHWHVSNEYGGYCYCENCAEAFRYWLKNKYSTIDSLNKAWNSNFWSHTYSSWSDIHPPMRITDVFSNNKPVLGGAALDYRRFQSDSLLNNYKIERDIIRKYDRERKITTNFMGSQKDLDYFKWAKELDIISWDNYPSFDTPVSFTAFQHDLMRGLKGQPFMLMEQTPNQQNWQQYNALKRPGEMRMLSYHALAHGANTVQFFQLKQSRNGAEKFHGAILSHSLSTEGRIFKEVKQLGEELAEVPEGFLSSYSKSKVAIIFDWDSYWGLENCIGPTSHLDYVESIYQYYKVLYERGINVDFVSRSDDFSSYSLLIAPVLYISTSELSKKIEKYTQDGGIFLTTTMSGLADENDNIHLGGYPGQWRKLLGISIEESDALPLGELIDLKGNGKIVGKASILCDLVQTGTAKIVGSYEGSVFYRDMACITVNKFGKGKAYYVGSYLDDRGLGYLMTEVLAAADIASVDCNEVEILTRSNKNEEYTFIINTTNQTKTVINPNPYRYDLITKEQRPDRFELAPFEVCLLYQKEE